MFSNLPREIEEEILSRVPIKSLRQLRATSKKWYHHPLFKDPKFIKRHSDKTPREYHDPIMLVDFKIQSMSSYVDRGRDGSQRFSLVDPVSNLEVDITQAFHCDGILLCTTKDKSFVAWNPFSGKTRWIQVQPVRSQQLYALGYDNKELCRSYKILRFVDQSCQNAEIYEFKSDSWRNIDVSPGGSFDSLGVSLKGNTYCVSKRKGAKEYSLLEFDFSTERFQNLFLPFHEEGCLGPFAFKEGLNAVALSAVREERLCLLYESKEKEKTQIWISSEFGDETTPVYWSKYFTVHSIPKFSRHVSFFVDDEEKLASCFYNYEQNLCKVMVFGDGASKMSIPGKEGYRSMGWHPRSKCGPIVFGYLPRS